MDAKQYHKEDTYYLWFIFLNNGSMQSFSALYDMYADELYSYGIHLGFNSDICKDAIHDIFLKLHVTRKKLKAVKNPAAYLFKSFKNLLIDSVRKESRNTDIDAFSDDFTIDITILDNMIDKEEAGMLKQKVTRMLDSLTGRERETVYLRFMFNLSYPEIGEILKINADSVKKSVYRIMEKLRKEVN